MTEKATKENTPKESTEKKKQSDLNAYVIKEQTKMTEIRWTFKVVMSHYSYNSSSNLKSLFKVMFPVSEICKNISLGSTEKAYTVCHGLAPYFRQKLLSCLEI